MGQTASMLAPGAYVVSPRHQQRYKDFLSHDAEHLQLEPHSLLLPLLLLWLYAGECLSESRR
jgi:hypothetical protein